MHIKLKSTRNNISIINIIAFFVIGWINGGVITLIPYFNAYVELFLFAAWLVFVYLSNYCLLTEMFTEQIWLTVLLLSCFPTALIVHGKLETNLMSFCFIYIIYTMYIFYRKNLNSKFTLFMFTFIIVDRLIVAIYTIFMLNKYPMLSRDLAIGSTIIQDYSKNFKMVAGFEAIYVSVFLVIFLSILLKSMKKPFKILCSIYIMVTIYMIIKASYTTAVLCLVIFLILSYLFSKRKTLLAFGFVFIVIIFYKNIGNIILSIADWDLWSNILSVKLRIFANALLGNEIDGTSLGLRVELITESLKTIKGNFFFGVYEKLNYDLLIGNHTEWIDKLALLGFFRFDLLLAFLIPAIKNVYTNYKIKRAFVMGISYIIFVGFVNPIINNYVILGIFIIVPFSNVIIKDKINETNFKRKVSL